MFIFNISLILETVFNILRYSKDKLLFHPPLLLHSIMCRFTSLSAEEFSGGIDFSTFHFIIKYFPPIFIGNHYQFKFSQAFNSFLFKIDVYVFLQMYLI